MEKLQNIAVIGAGAMGNGIAHVFAQNGFKVNLIDQSKEALSKAISIINKNLDRQIKRQTINNNDKEKTLENISTFNEINKGVKESDLVVEAATEHEQTKFKIFETLSQLTRPDCILASNTSSISITKIASVTSRPSMVIGMHFMNPVPVMGLVEVIKGYATSDQTTKTVLDLCASLDKTPVEVNDYPGFVANRILLPMINEAIVSLFEGVAGVIEIDTVMKLGMAHPMGPLQLADFIGLDVCLSILNVLKEGLGNPKYAPCPLLTNMVTAGFLGVKTGEGFYKYSAGNKELTVSPMFQ